MFGFITSCAAGGKKKKKSMAKKRGKKAASTTIKRVLLSCKVLVNRFFFCFFFSILRFGGTARGRITLSGEKWRPQKPRWIQTRGHEGPVTEPLHWRWGCGWARTRDGIFPQRSDDGVELWNGIRVNHLGLLIAEKWEEPVYVVHRYTDSGAYGKSFSNRQTGREALRGPPVLTAVI